MSDASDPVENDTEFQLQMCNGCGHTRRAHHPGAYHNADQRAIHHSCRPPCPCSEFLIDLPDGPRSNLAATLPDPDVAEPSHLRFAAAIAGVHFGPKHGEALLEQADLMAELSNAQRDRASHMLRRVRQYADDLSAAPQIGYDAREQWESDTERRIGGELVRILGGES
ncbi:hypothetical protein SEA_PERIWINKLE_60 [Gordonia phage Periwinkle]|nr:hypothetical protein SEA_PERIWINKLE_60 [Gordonia phage Periwinkle]